MENNLKQLRFERRLTQEELAKAAGISRTTLAMIECGRTVPDGKTIAKLVAVLKIPANKIFFALDVI